MSSDPEKVGDCWHCGGYVAVGSVPDDYVFIGALVFHRGCGERLRDELDEVLQ